MTKAIATVEEKDQNAAIFKLVTSGDTANLTDAQKMQYYLARCEESGLDPATTPFQFIKVKGGREVLYALKGATDQLSKIHKLKMTITDQETTEGVRVVTVRAEAGDGRITEEIGSVPIGGLKGEDLSNALMKCVTKAKRRAVLSITGLGMMDETEVATIIGTGAAKPFGGTDVDQEFPEPKATGSEDAPDPETLEPPVTDAEIVEETEGRVIEVKEVEKPKKKLKDSSAFKDDTTSDASDWMMVGKAVRVHALDKKKVKEGYIEHFGIESMKELNRGQIRELIYLMGGSKKKAWAK